MPTEQDILACWHVVNFRARQFRYALSDESVGLPSASPEMALYDLEEAIDELRSVFDQRSYEIRKS